MPAGDSGEAARFTRSANYRRIREADAKRSAQRSADRRRIVRFGPKGSVTRADHDDPVGNFLGGIAKAIGGKAEDVVEGGKQALGMAGGRTPTRRKVAAVTQEVRRAGREAARGYVRERRAAFTPDFARTPSQRRQMRGQQQSLDISPGMISQIIKAGGATILNPGKLPLRQLGERLPTKHGGAASRAARVPEGRQTGDINVGGRIPWLVDRETGRVHVGPVGANHGALYPPGMPMDRFRQGWLYNPAEEYASITVGTGNPMTRLSKEEEQGMYQLLYKFFGYDSPVTDAMVKTQKSGPGFDELPRRIITRQPAFGARQGKRADDLFEELGGPMGHREFNEFLQAELKRKRKR
jgi:hypothetical protein